MINCVDIPAQTPQLWQGIAQHLAQTHPDVLVLLHPMHMAPAAHSHRALQVKLALATCQGMMCSECLHRYRHCAQVVGQANVPLRTG